MIVANMYEAKTHLSKLVQMALRGEDVVLAKSGKPLVRLVPAEVEKTVIKFGLMKGQIHVADDFNSFGPELQA